MPACYTFRATATADAPAVLSIDSEIGFWGTQAGEFRQQLNAVTGNALHVEINSSGGDVFTALGIYNMLRHWAAQAGRSLTTRVMGLAASAASIIALAGDRREMPANTFAMIHGVSGGAWGSADDMREAADLTEKVQAGLRAIYVARMGIDDQKAAAMMEQDTWMSAQEALECGFATHVLEAVELAAHVDLIRCAAPAHVARWFKAQAEPGPAPVPVPAPVPGPIPAPVPAPEPAPVPEPIQVPESTQAQAIASLAEQSGLTNHASYFALACSSVSEARERIAQARGIMFLCQLAGAPEKSDGFIRANKPLTEVRTDLLQTLADADEHTNNAPRSSSDSAAAGGFSTRQLWARHLQQGGGKA